MAIIELENVGKRFAARRGRQVLMGRRGLAALLRGRQNDTFEALHEITFNIEAGQSCGIIGANGSGKSTLLKLLAGVTVPTTGHVTVRGRVASLLELGAGFHPLLTGRENVFLNGRVLGMSRADVKNVYDRIVEFAGIEAFMDNPVETYSSGMFVRLAFSVAVHANPDIFLVDEVLAVGDEEFQRKCRLRIIELRDQGKTIVFVSHDLGLVNALCNQVVLLSKGRMITRGSPQQTIDYYLRQTGSPDSIHTFSDGRVDAVLAQGRLSLYRDQKELTAPSGLQAEVYSMERHHPAREADWHVTERGPSHCVAHGRMIRLPLTHVWSLRVEGDVLTWDVAVECERPTPATLHNVNLAFPALYREWLYGELAGQFPDILPTDLSWSLVAAYTVPCREAAVFSPDESSVPSIDMRIESAHPFVRLMWFNGDYLSGMRVLQVNTALPPHEAQFPVGRTHLFTLAVDMGTSSEDLRRRVEVDRTVRSGSLSARFDGGSLRINCGGTELTRAGHVYASLLIGQLWNDSRVLQWGSVEHSEEGTQITGMSRRFPHGQRWVIRPVPKGIHVEIWLEAQEAFEVQEYQVSAMLRPEYDHWETESESGEFAAISPQQEDWVHLNRDYALGSQVSARGLELPRVTLASDCREYEPRMTVLNTTYSENARVIQALHVPPRGVFHFEKGRYLLFSGTVSVEE